MVGSGQGVRTEAEGGRQSQRRHSPVLVLGEFQKPSRLQGPSLGYARPRTVTMAAARAEEPWLPRLTQN